MNVLEIGGPEISGCEDETATQETREGAGENRPIETDDIVEENPFDVSAPEEKSYSDEEDEEPLVNRRPGNGSGRGTGIRLARNDSFDYSQQEKELNMLRDELEFERREKKNLETENNLLHGQVNFLKCRLQTVNGTPGLMSPGSDFTQNSLQMSGRIGSNRVPSPMRRSQEVAPASCAVKRPRTSSYAKQQEQQRKQDLKLNVPMERVYEKQIRSLMLDKESLEKENEELRLQLEEVNRKHTDEIKGYKDALTQEKINTKTSRAATRAAQRELAEKDKEKVEKAKNLDTYPAMLSASILRKITPILNHYITSVRDRRAAPTVNTLVEGDLIMELLELAKSGVATVSAAPYAEKQVVSTYTESALDRLIRDMKKKITIRNYEKLENEPLAESSMRLSTQIKPAEKPSAEMTARTPGLTPAPKGNKPSGISTGFGNQNKALGPRSSVSKSSKVTYDIDGRPIVSGTPYNRGPSSPTSPVSEAKLNLAKKTEERRKARLMEQNNIKMRRKIWGFSDDGESILTSKKSEKKAAKKADGESAGSATSPSGAAEAEPEKVEAPAEAAAADGAAEVADTPAE